jgi:hypothetical protein
MKRSVKLTGLVIFLSLMLAGGIVFAAGTTAPAPGTTAVKPKPPGPCCIAGKYQGSSKDNLPASKTCPTPGSGKFTMEIMQDKGCGSKIWGTVTQLKDGSTEKFEGKVMVREKCCYIEGVVQGPPAATGGPGQTTKFQGLLCKKDGKFVGNGTYTHYKGGVAGCSGKWEMTQM